MERITAEEKAEEKTDSLEKMEGNESAGGFPYGASANQGALGKTYGCSESIHIP